MWTIRSAHGSILTTWPSTSQQRWYKPGSKYKISKNMGTYIKTCSNCQFIINYSVSGVADVEHNVMKLT